MTIRGDSIGLTAGFACDLIFGDPRRGHPVAGFGRCAAVVERRLYRDNRACGALFTLIAAGAPVALGIGLSRGLGRGVLRQVSVASATWAVLGGTSLTREARSMQARLETNDLAAARLGLSSLCGRDASELDAVSLARATVESVAENTSDAIVAPLFWGAVAGLPGLLGYRAINTLDAMVGHRSARYTQFGAAAARLDDVVNLIPARVSAGLTALAAPMVGGSARVAATTVLRDGGAHPSPNAGQVEAAFAGALGVRLGGPNVYDGRVDDRPHLGCGRPVVVADIARAATLSQAVSVGALALAVSVATLRGRRW